MRKKGEVMNRSLIDQNLFPQTRCLDIVQRYVVTVLFNFLPSKNVPPACGEHRKWTCLKKNKYSSLAFTCSIRREYLIVAALFRSNMKMLLNCCTELRGDSQNDTFQYVSMRIVECHYQQLLTWQDCKLSVELLYYIHCYQRPDLLLHDFICARENRNLQWVHKALMIIFFLLWQPSKTKMTLKEKEPIWIIAWAVIWLSW